MNNSVKIKSKIIILLAIILFSCQLNAQKYRGIQMIGLNGYKSDFGFMADLSYQKYFTNQFSFRGSLAGEYSNKLNMIHSSGYINAEALYDFFDSRKKVVMNVGGGLSFSQDKLDNNQELGANFVRTSTNFGVLASGQMEFYISRKVMMDIRGSYNYNFLTKFAQHKYWVGAGINLLLY